MKIPGGNWGEAAPHRHPACRSQVWLGSACSPVPGSQEGATKPHVARGPPLWYCRWGGNAATPTQGQSEGTCAELVGSRCACSSPPCRSGLVGPGEWPGPWLGARWPSLHGNPRVASERWARCPAQCCGPAPSQGSVTPVTPGAQLCTPVRAREGVHRMCVLPLQASVFPTVKWPKGERGWGWRPVLLAVVWSRGAHEGRKGGLWWPER